MLISPTILFLQLVVAAIGFSCLVWPIFRYFRDPKQLRRYPGPFLAGITNIWIMYKHYIGQRTSTVHELHQKHGKILRIGPNSLSFSSLDAARDIYGHGTPTSKDRFYDSLAGVHRQLFDSIDKEEHARKRKLFAAAFAQKSVEEKEYHVNADIAALVRQFDRLCTDPPAAAKGQTILYDKDQVQREFTDARRWFNLLTLDLAADFAFGIKLGFVKQGDDWAVCETLQGERYMAHPEASTNPNLLITSTLGYARLSFFNVNRKLFKWHRGWRDGEIVTDFVIHLVRKRLAAEKDGQERSDFFQALSYSRDGVPTDMEFGELIQECALLMVAGSETTACALQNIFYFLILHPRCMQTLYEELESALGNEDGDDDELVPAYDRVKFLPYLRAVIDETLRLRPSLPIALPRTTPPDGMNIAGVWVPGNTTVSASTWTIHRDPELFERPLEFLPERWLGENGVKIQKGFMAFSSGARACVGRNMAYMELTLVVAALVHRYHFALPSPDWKPTICETFVIKSGPMPVKIWRRRGGRTKSLA
jgi:cytochrome P450